MNKTKIDKLYRKDEVEKRELAKKASVTFEYIKNCLEHQGFTVGDISQDREVPDPMLTTENYPVGEMNIRTRNLETTDKIKELEALTQFNLKIVGGYENENEKNSLTRGMHGAVWGNTESFMKDYQEKWREEGKPDYLVLVGKDSISDGKIVLLVGLVEDNKRKGLLARILGE